MIAGMVIGAGITAVGIFQLKRRLAEMYPDTGAPIPGKRTLALVASGSVGRGLDLNRRTRCCTMPAGPQRDRVCASSPCRTTPHWGLDLPAPAGTPVYAAKDGIVRQQVLSGYGNTVLLSHADGRQSTLYAHLSRYSTANGATVRAGQQIGEVGNSGIQPMGEHLHFEVHNSPQPNLSVARLDPRQWLTAQGIDPVRQSAGTAVAFVYPDSDGTSMADFPTVSAPSIAVTAAVGIATISAVAFLVGLIPKRTRKYDF